MRVTLLELHLGGACAYDRRVFKRTFGRSAEINAENLEKAVNAGLGVTFYINYVDSLYNRKRRREVERLYREYHSKMRAALYDERQHDGGKR
jgi:hypothetical protein